MALRQDQGNFLIESQVKAETTWLNRLAKRQLLKPSSEPDACQRVLAALSSTAKPGSSPQLTHSGMKSNEATPMNEMLVAAAVAVEKLARQPENAALLMKAGVATVLISHLAISSRRPQKLAAAAAIALQVLALNGEHAELIVKAKAVSPLLPLAYSNSEELQRPAAAAISNLLLVNSNRAAVNKTSTVEALVYLMKSDRETVRHPAANALMILTLDPCQQARAGNVGAIPLLVSILQTAPQHWQAIAATALQNLACEENNKRRLVEAGAIPHLLKALSSSSVPVQEGAAGTILNMAADSDIQRILGEAGAIAALLPALQSDSDRLQRYACGAALNLSQNQCNRDRLAQIAEALLQRSFHSHSEEAQQNASLVMWNLVKGNMTAFLEVEIKKALMQTLSGPSLPLFPDLGLDRAWKSTQGWMKSRGSACANFLRRTYAKRKDTKKSGAAKEGEGEAEFLVKPGKYDVEKGGIVDLQASPL